MTDEAVREDGALIRALIAVICRGISGGAPMGSNIDGEGQCYI